MMNLLKNKRIIIPLAVLTCALTAGALAADPGSSSDPLISLSYFENKIETLKSTILEEITKTFSEKFAK